MLKQVFIYSLVVLFFSLSQVGAEVTFHPPIPLLDAAGVHVLKSGKPYSEERTCGSCHDVRFIQAHSVHSKEFQPVACDQCHSLGGKLRWTAASFDASGNLKREALNIGRPQNQNCADCHGYVHMGKDPLKLPQDFATAKTYQLTQNTGAVISPQKIKESLLNIKDKASIDHAWDVHALQEVGCIACHYTKNGPYRSGVNRKEDDPPHLRFDPRQEPLGDYIRRPNHEFTRESCTTCHNPATVHSFFPYDQRHLYVMSCQTCHIPQLWAPAFQSVDMTVFDREGKNPLQFRGVKGISPNLATDLVEGFLPAFFPRTSARDGRRKIYPFNLITEWTWNSEGNRVADDLVRKAFLTKDGKSYAPELLAQFSVSDQATASDLILNTREKVDFVRDRLSALGVQNPEIQGKVRAYPVMHGIQDKKGVTRNCNSCHSSSSRFGQEIVLSTYRPFGAQLELPEQLALSEDNLNTKASGELVLKKHGAPEGYYILGKTRPVLINLIGIAFLILTLLGVSIHGGLRIYTRKKHHHAHPERKMIEVVMYSAYERVWHWLSAFGIMALMATGIAIHMGSSLGSFPFKASVQAHNILAGILVVNAFLALFYHVVTAEIMGYIPKADTFIAQAIAQVRYYTYGIFKGHPHPLRKAPHQKLNPLQQMTYLGLLNVLLPIQVITGVLIWGAERWPEISDRIGGLTIISPIHLLCSWLFGSFIVTHVYLTTTGHTPLSNIRAMITGKEEIEADEE